jgi:hypothetical protein
MTTLTPGCDPDMSITGAPYGETSGGPRVRSAVILLAVVAGAALLATGGSVPGAVAVPAAVIGLLCAVVLVRRAVRLAHRAGVVAAGSAGSVARAVHRSGPVPTATP